MAEPLPRMYFHHIEGEQLPRIWVAMPGDPPPQVVAEDRRRIELQARKQP